MSNSKILKAPELRACLVAEHIVLVDRISRKADIHLAICRRETDDGQSKPRERSLSPLLTTARHCLDELAVLQSPHSSR